jgi:hypothetical protein
LLCLSGNCCFDKRGFVVALVIVAGAAALSMSDSQLRSELLRRNAAASVSVAGLIFLCGAYVSFWHKADITRLSSNVCFTAR